MPEMTKEELDLFFENCMKNAIPLTLSISKEEEEKAKKQCDEYIKNRIINVYDMKPLTVYFIISKLSENDQIKFIRENINYIKDNDEEIFLYTMLAPKSLSYFLSIKVLKEIRKLDLNIFKKIISQNLENLLHGFSHKDYIELYIDCFNEIEEIENIEFINGLYLHNRLCYDKILNTDISYLKNILKLQVNYNKEFIDIILDKYKNKISTFKPNELLRFITYIEDEEVYKKFIQENYKKLNEAFSNISEYNLKDCLSELNQFKQEILINTFFDNIIKKQDIKKIISNIKTDIIIELYNKNKEIFNSMTLKDWIEFCSKKGILNEDLKKILDTYDVDNIESLFNIQFFITNFYKDDLEALKYVEMKYRNNIKINGILESIDENTSIFSNEYLKNIQEIREMFKNKSISKNDKIYKQHLSNFILHLKNKNIINDIEGNNFKEIEKLFYRFVMGTSFTILYQLSSIEEITILNRLGKIDFKVQDFSVNQLENYNVKLHKQLYKQFEDNIVNIRDYKKLILKLILIVGFNHAKTILEIDNELPTLEHLVGNINVKDVILNEQGNPILNTKIMNLLFSDKNYSKIKEMLFNKDNDLYKYFPRIFNEWKMIQLNNKDNSLQTIIEFLKTDEILLSPKYYRLEGLFKFIGCRNEIVNETFSLHDQMLNRIDSTIPRIVGTKDEYSYEILKLDDMESLTIGNKTNCCFTVLGNGYPCLKHAVTSKNGRILVIRKNNELLAHSWIWRNGDLLCLDNIENSKTITEVDFFDVYLQFADELIRESFEKEGINNCIKNITIGFTNFDKKVKGIENYPCLISKKCDLEKNNFENKLGNNRKFVDTLPQPIEEVDYSDSKNVQYLIRGSGKFNLGQSYYNYEDERTDVMHYVSDNSYDDQYLEEINKRVNALRYIQVENNNNIDSFKFLDIKTLSEVYCNSDWYIITYSDGSVEEFNNSSNIRAIEEMNQIKRANSKVLKKIN